MTLYQPERYYSSGPKKKKKQQIFPFQTFYFSFYSLHFSLTLDLYSLFIYFSCFIVSFDVDQS